MEWYQVIEAVTPYVVRIATPQGSGTGWLVSRSKTSKLCAIATAAHVIDHAHYWEEPIRLIHPASGKSVVLRAPDRSVHLDPALDSGAIIFNLSELPLPDKVPKLVSKNKFIKPGVEVGWLGFPAIPQAEICFFSGRISSYLGHISAYLVDGVAINGVSGGPAVRLNSPQPFQVIGIVSAYVPNRATGEVLPGVAVIREAIHFHGVTKRFRSFDEAKKQETPPTAPAAVEPAADGSPARTAR